MANRIQESFDDIKADSRLKESTKQLLAKRRGRTVSLWHRPAFRRAFAAVCVVLLLIAGAGGYTWVQMPVAYVSIDVNPSIELALNRFDKVMSVTAYNDEGRGIIEKLSLKGKKYTEAIDLLVESGDMRAYLTDQSELVFTVAADSSREEALKAGIERCSEYAGCRSSSYGADLAIVPEAHEHDVSVGRYSAYLELSQYDDSITIDDCQHMTMSEIHGLIQEHHQEDHQEHGQESQDGGHHDGESGHHGEGDHH